jgi:hypothetical protein
MSLFPCLVLSFSQIWLNLPMDDGHFGYITKALIHSFAPETLLPSACTTFLLEEEPTDHQLIFQPVSKYLSNQTEI